MKLISSSIEAARLLAAKVRGKVGQRLPQPVAADGGTPRLWSDCTGWVVDEGVDITVDDQDLVDAIAAAPKKLTNAEDTPAKVRAKLAAEIAAAKAARESKGGGARGAGRGLADDR